MEEPAQASAFDNPKSYFIMVIMRWNAHYDARVFWSTRQPTVRFNDINKRMDRHKVWFFCL